VFTGNPKAVGINLYKWKAMLFSEVCNKRQVIADSRLPSGELEIARTGCFTDFFKQLVEFVNCRVRGNWGSG